MCKCKETPKCAFNFPMPKGFEIENEVPSNYKIVRHGGRTVGEITATNLDEQVFSEGGINSLVAYLRTYVPEPLVMEYMIDKPAADVLDITLIKVNQKAGTFHEESHYIFQYNATVYDMWLDSLQVDEDIRNKFLAAVRATGTIS